MPKQSLKLKLARTCALACIVGLSANTFVVAGKSIANTKNKSVRVSPDPLTAEPNPEPTPTPASTDDGKERRRGADAMLRHKILIVSSEPAMRRSLKRLMTATGAVTEFVNDLSKLPTDAPSLIAVDLRSPSAPKMKELETVFPDVRLIAIVGGQDFGQMVEAMRSPRCGSPRATR